MMYEKDSNGNIVLPFSSYRWSTFSFFDIAKNRMWRLAGYVRCKTLNLHNWNVVIKHWDYSDVDNVEQFRKHCASQLYCEFCKVEKNKSEIDFDGYEAGIYKAITSLYFTNHYL